MHKWTYPTWRSTEYWMCSNKLYFTQTYVASSVVIVWHFSRSVGVSMKKTVVGSVLVFIRVHLVPLYTFHDVRFGAIKRPSRWASGVHVWCILPSMWGGYDRIGLCFACDAKCVRKQSDLESVRSSQHRKYSYKSAADTVAVVPSDWQLKHRIITILLNTDGQTASLSIIPPLPHLTSSVYSCYN